MAVPSGRGAPHHRHLYAVKFTSATMTKRGTRNQPQCLSCSERSMGETRHRKRREFGGKQNRMDEARDDRLRQQQRERNLKEQEKDNEDQAAANAEGTTLCYHISKFISINIGFVISWMFRLNILLYLLHLPFSSLNHPHRN